LKDRPIPVARIGAAHGVKGEVRLKVYSGDAGAIARYKTLRDGSGRAIEIRSLRASGKALVAALHGVADRDAAQALVGAELFVSREEAAAGLARDEYLAADLVGMAVSTNDGAPFGVVADVANYGAGDILEIRLAGGGGEMFAFTARNFPRVDLAARRIVIDPPGAIAGEESAP
jgi:16S rRNA processing protein RimM